jgi:hypothetical protein
MTPAGLVIWFLLSALVGWVLVDLYIWARRPRRIKVEYRDLPQRDRASIGRAEPVFTGLVTPNEIRYLHGFPGVLTTEEPLTEYQRDDMLLAWQRGDAMDLGPDAR